MRRTAGRLRACWPMHSMRLTCRPAAASTCVARGYWGLPCPPPSSHHLYLCLGLLMVLAVAAASLAAALTLCVAARCAFGRVHRRLVWPARRRWRGGLVLPLHPSTQALHRQVASSLHHGGLVCGLARSLIGSWALPRLRRTSTGRVHLSSTPSQSQSHHSQRQCRNNLSKPQSQSQRLSRQRRSPSRPIAPSCQSQCHSRQRQCTSHMLQSQSQSHYRQRQRQSTLTLQSQSQSHSRQRQRLRRVNQPRCQSQCHSRQSQS